MRLQVADVNVAILVVFAISSMSVYGIVLAGWIWFLIKVGALLFFYVWMRWTLPRYRYDQLMSFGWKVLLPASVINLLVTAAGVLYFGL